MKTFAQIRKEIEKAYKVQNDLENRKDALVEEWSEISDIKARIEHKKTKLEELQAIDKAKTDTQLKIKILKSNAKIALFNESVPVALEILAKYKGKPYGKATAAKISEEMENRTGCRLLIGWEWYSTETKLNIYAMNTDFNIQCGTSGKDKEEFLNNENKIQVIPLEKIGLRYTSSEYVENIPKRIQELRKARLKAARVQRELEELCSTYNRLAVGEIEYIYSEKHIYNF